MDSSVFLPLVAAALAVVGAAVKAFERNLGAAVAYAAVSLLAIAAATASITIATIITVRFALVISYSCAFTYRTHTSASGIPIASPSKYACETRRSWTPIDRIETATIADRCPR